MLDLSDPQWANFKGGYKLEYDASERLRELENGKIDIDVITSEFWDELHHQGDVGLASYAAVTHLVRICIQRDILEWNIFALVACIEACRIFGKNPPLPAWLESDYFSAIRNLADYGAHRFNEEWPRELTQTFLSVAAFSKGLPKQGRVLIEFTGDDELDEIFERFL